MEPLVFKPFKTIRETFCRNDFPAGQYVQKAIEINPIAPWLVTVSFADERGTGIGGTNQSSNSITVRLSPKEIIVLKDLLAKLEITENTQSVSEKQTRSV